jgi:hypothetical protein
MKTLLLAALLLLPLTAFAEDACKKVRPFAKPGETLVHVNGKCFAVTQQELRRYLNRLTGSSAVCDSARAQLQTGEVLVVKPGGMCAAMPKQDLAHNTR